MIDSCLPDLSNVIDILPILLDRCYKSQLYKAQQILRSELIIDSPIRTPLHEEGGRQDPMTYYPHGAMEISGLSQPVV